MTELRTDDLRTPLPEPNEIEFIGYIKKDLKFNIEAHWAENLGKYNHNTDAWLQLLHIPEELRGGVDGTHYGTNILDEFEKRCRSSSVRKICAYVNPRNPDELGAMLKFYRNKGYSFDEIDQTFLLAYKYL